MCHVNKPHELYDACFKEKVAQMKVLIISHNATSNINNMGKTIKSLFSAFEKEELCQLYVHPAIPDADICSSYYRITDASVLRGYFSLQAPGEEISTIEHIKNENRIFENEKTSAIYGRKNNHTAFKRILRDIMWNFSRWDSKGLYEWLEREKPTCIFLAPGYAKFIYDIAIKISKRLSIPIITYICDDYYFVKTPKSIVGRIQLSLLKKKMSALMDISSHLIVICQEMKDVYSKKFSLPISVIMTGSVIDKPVKHNKSTNEIQKLCYFGNLSCNRHVSLCEIGRALTRINEVYDAEFELDIYSGENNEAILNPLREIESVNICGFVTGQAFEKAFLSSDILIHTEAFDDESIDLVKFSISTKIADSLASGIPLFAYGPKKVASIQHLLRNQCAIVATSEDSVFDILTGTLTDENARSAVVTDAIKTAKKYHNADENGRRVKELLHEIFGS